MLLTNLTNHIIHKSIVTVDLILKYLRVTINIRDFE